METGSSLGTVFKLILSILTYSKAINLNLYVNKKPGYLGCRAFYLNVTVLKDVNTLLRIQPFFWKVCL
jgi:hypothetical protein